MRDLDVSHLLDIAKNALDGVSFGVAVATVLSFLPQIAALASLIWTGIRVYEWWRGR